MSLSETLISEFVKVSNNTEKKTNNDSLLFGTIVVYGEDKYVKIDGSDLLTPINKTVTLKNNDRVSLSIKNHIATILGNLTSPSASASDLSELGNTVTEFGNVVAHSLTTDEIQAISAKVDLIKAQLIQSTAITSEELIAINAVIDNIKSEYVDTDYLTADNIKAINGKLDNLSADLINTYHIETELMTAVTAEINYLKTYSAEFTYVTALKADIEDLNVDKLSVESAEAKYANVDFANVSLANIGELFTKAGIIGELVVGDQTITGKLVGVTITGDLIEANTLKANRLILQGDDGLYYQLNVSGEKIEAEQTEYNSLNGDVITAQSITASKIYVSDLSAFNATIGGYKIDSDRIYSGIKSSVDNTTRGSYLDSHGQINFGDSENYLKYYKEYLLTETQPDNWITNWADYYVWDNNNLCPPFSYNKWVFVNGAYLRNGWIYLPNETSYAYINTPWNQKASYFYFGLTVQSNYFDADPQAGVYIASSYLLDGSLLTGNGYAYAITSAYEQRVITQFGQETNPSQYGQAIAQADTIRLHVKRGPTHGRQPYRFKDFSIGLVRNPVANPQLEFIPISNPTAPTWQGNTYYYETGNYVLDIAASNITFGLNNNNLQNYTNTNNENMNSIFKKLAYVEVSSDVNNPYIELGKLNDPFKVKVTNTEMDFLEGTNVVAYISNETLNIEKSIIKDNLTIGENKYVLTLTEPIDWATNYGKYYTKSGNEYVINTSSTWSSNTYYKRIYGFSWKQRENGNVGLSWDGGNA